VSPFVSHADSVCTSLMGRSFVLISLYNQASVQLLTMLVHATPDMQPSDPLLTKYVRDLECRHI
jgi:hypothetical protein